MHTVHVQQFDQVNILIFTGTSEKTSTAASTPTTVSTDTPAPVNKDASDEMIKKNRERMMKKMAGKSPKAASAGFVFPIRSSRLFKLC